MLTRDIDIRKALHSQTLMVHKDDPNTIVVDELGICQGTARIDIAVINGAINGYEIKSDKDTLSRLPAQIDSYCRVLDTITFVIGECHFKNLIQLVPEWCGIQTVNADSENNIEFQIIREPQQNPHIDPYSLAELLWRNEALQILADKELEKGLISKPRKILWNKLAQSLPLHELQYHVRECLKERKNWRVDLQ